MNRLMELSSFEMTNRMYYDKKQLALECIVQFCHINHFPAELFVNFDCSLYCSNVFENLTKTLSKVQICRVYMYMYSFRAKPLNQAVTEIANFTLAHLQHM